MVWLCQRCGGLGDRDVTQIAQLRVGGLFAVRIVVITAVSPGLLPL